MRQHWPERMWIVRHGQSQGNVARDEAHEAGAHEIGINMRDVDVPLSELGFRQAQAAGRWFAQLPREERPEVILSSPYIRARQTAAAICEAGALAGGPQKPIVDERLREREFGIFDGLTTIGIRDKYPEEAAHRARLGKFYHRPPGGESWADVILRLRSAMNSINLHYSGRRVLIVCHQVVVLCMRYILERMTEAEILSIDGQGDVANCSVTHYRLDESSGHLKLERYNATAPMRQEGTETTSEPDQMVAARG